MLKANLLEESCSTRILNKEQLSSQLLAVAQKDCRCSITKHHQLQRLHTPPSCCTAYSRLTTNTTHKASTIHSDPQPQLITQNQHKTNSCALSRQEELCTSSPLWHIHLTMKRIHSQHTGRCRHQVRCVTTRAQLQAHHSR